MTPDIHIIGIGLRGPGLLNWPKAKEILIHGGFESLSETPPGVATLLPPTERRRATTVTRLALDVIGDSLQPHFITPSTMPQPVIGALPAVPACRLTAYVLMTIASARVSWKAYSGFKNQKTGSSWSPMMFLRPTPSVLIDQ